MRRTPCRASACAGPLPPGSHRDAPGSSVLRAALPPPIRCQRVRARTDSRAPASFAAPRQSPEISSAYGSAISVGGSASVHPNNHSASSPFIRRSRRVGAQIRRLHCANAASIAGDPCFLGEASANRRAAASPGEPGQLRASASGVATSGSPRRMRKCANRERRNARDGRALDDEDGLDIFGSSEPVALLEPRRRATPSCRAAMSRGRAARNTSVLRSGSASRRCTACAESPSLRGSCTRARCAPESLARVPASSCGSDHPIRHRCQR